MRWVDFSLGIFVSGFDSVFYLFFAVPTLERGRSKSRNSELIRGVFKRNFTELRRAPSTE